MPLGYSCWVRVLLVVVAVFPPSKSEYHSGFGFLQTQPEIPGVAKEKKKYPKELGSSDSMLKVPEKCEWHFWKVKYNEQQSSAVLVLWTVSVAHGERSHRLLTMFPTLGFSRALISPSNGTALRFAPETAHLFTVFASFLFKTCQNRFFLTIILGFPTAFRDVVTCLGQSKLV